MKATVLHQNQIKHTLSAKKNNPTKKKKAIDVVRTVLSSKNTSKAYYRLPEELCNKFGECMSGIFKYKPQILPKWSEMKNIPREKRKEYKSQFIQKKELHPSKSHFIFGLNAVTKSVETKTAKLVILSEDINPTTLYKHICQCCKLYKIPLFIIKNFRTVTENCFGFRSMTVAIKKFPDDDVIKQIYDFLMSSLPIVYKETLESSPEVSVEDPDPKSVVENIQVPEEMETSEIKQDVYLFRNNKKQRCFVPEVKLDKPKVSNMDFISVENISNGKKKTKKRLREESKKDEQYQKLQVKKFKKNKDRVNKRNILKVSTC